MGEATTLPVAQVRPADDNIRAGLGDVDGLAADIAEHGVLQRINVRRNGDGYQIISGHRRYAAAVEAGLDEVPVEIVDVDDDQRLVRMFSENFHRADLTELEEAYAFRRALDELDLTQRELADRLSCAQSHISKRLKLLNLVDAAQDRLGLDDGDPDKLNVTDAVELAKLPADRQTAALEDAGERDYMSVARAISRQQSELKTERAIAKARQQLADDGIPEVDWDDVSWNVTKRGDPVRVFTLQGGYVVDGDHADLDCHAAAVDPRRAEVVDVCTDPTSHPRAQLELTAEDRAYERQQAKAKAADEARWDACRTAVQEAPIAEAVIHAMRCTVRDWGHTYRWQAGKACDLLDIDPGFADGDRDWAGALAEYAVRGRDETIRALLALTLISAERSCDGGRIIASRLPSVRAHFAFLQAHTDWEPSDLEAEALADAEDDR